MICTPRSYAVVVVLLLLLCHIQVLYLLNTFACSKGPYSKIERGIAVCVQVCICVHVILLLLQANTYTYTLALTLALASMCIKLQNNTKDSLLARYALQVIYMHILFTKIKE